MKSRWAVGICATSCLLLFGLMASAQQRPSQTGRTNLKPRSTLMAENLPSNEAGRSAPSITVKVNPKDGLKYVWIPAGTFEMGCSVGDKQCDPDEKPRHRVTISKGFWLGQTDTTVAGYKRFVAAMKARMKGPVKKAPMNHPPAFGAGTSSEAAMPKAPLFNKGWNDNNQPIVDVTWKNSHDYCQWIGGHLPSEAEWEYAARGGSSASRYGPLNEIAWYGDNSGRKPLDTTQMWADPANRHSYLGTMYRNGNGAHDVALKRPNAFGLYDMLGNVYDYTNDWYSASYYSHSPSVDPPGPKKPDLDSYQVLRGGSWVDQPFRVRVSYRDGRGQGFQIGIDGFRCVWNAPAP